MLKNYFLLSLRNLWKNRMFTFINVLGLAIGLATALLILLWVKDESSFDKFHKNSANLFRVMESIDFSGKQMIIANTQGPLADVIKSKYPEVAGVSPYGWAGGLLKARAVSAVNSGFAVSADFFRMFSFPFLEGDNQNALQKPNSIVITEKLRKKYFGNKAAVGQTILMENKDPYEVTGVIKEIPRTSSLQFDFIIPFATLQKNSKWLTEWNTTSPSCFVLLKQGIDPQKFQAKMANEVMVHNKQQKISLFLQPFADQYLYSDFSSGKSPGGRIQYVQMFSIIGVLILLIACINFMNLSTASSAKRAKEIGVRKVVGAEKRSLVFQFLLESILLSALAMLLAVGIVLLILPVFNSLVNKEIKFSILSLENILLIAGIMLASGLVAGSYPALFLSSFKPVLILKGARNNEGNSALLRKGLVVFQFCMSIMLIVGTVIVYRQVNFLKNKDLGLNKSNLLEIDMNQEVGKSFKVFQNTLESSGSVKGVSFSIQNLFSVQATGSGFKWPGKSANENIEFPLFWTDSHLMKTLGLSLKTGRNLVDGDSTGIVLSEEAVREMKLKEPVIGTHINANGIESSVIGIMKDFHITDLHSPMLPSVFLYYAHPADMNHIFIRTEPGKTLDAIKTLKETWSKLSPSYELDYKFFDQEYGKLYSADQLIGTLAAYFAGITIFISCLGLLGLSIFTAEQRMKEVSIRKVVGAGVFSIVFLLSRSFLKLVLLANLIAWPLSFYFADKWLGNYAYRIHIGFWMYLSTALAAVTIALITMSYHSIKAARMNPARVLRND